MVSSTPSTTKRMRNKLAFLNYPYFSNIEKKVSVLPSVHPIETLFSEMVWAIHLAGTKSRKRNNPIPVLYLVEEQRYETSK